MKAINRPTVPYARKHGAIKMCEMCFMKWTAGYTHLDQKWN